MMKNAYIIILIVLVTNIIMAAKNNSSIHRETSIKALIADKKNLLKRYNKDLKSLKRNNARSEDIQNLKTKINNLHTEIRKLKKEEKTSNSFAQEAKHAELRTTVDTSHAQDVYNAKYMDTPLHPTQDPHTQLGSYFRNH